MEMKMSSRRSAYLGLTLNLTKRPDGLNLEQLFYLLSIDKPINVRGKKAYLSIKRRRWEVKATGIIISRDWRIVQSGTRMTREFAAFLKGIFG